MLEQDKITGLLIEQYKYPEVIEVVNELENFTALIGRDVEVCSPYEKDVVFLVDSEGKLNGKDYNRTIFDEEGNMQDIIAGTFMIVGMKDEMICSLNQEQIERFSEMFHTPEAFVKMGRGVINIKMSDEMVKSANEPRVPKISKSKKQEL